MRITTRVGLSAVCVARGGDGDDGDFVIRGLAVFDSGADVDGDTGRGSLTAVAYVAIAVEGTGCVVVGVGTGAIGGTAVAVWEVIPRLIRWKTESKRGE
jgi:hypothetical protein